MLTSGALRALSRCELDAAVAQEHAHSQSAEEEVPGAATVLVLLRWLAAPDRDPYLVEVGIRIKAWRIRRRVSQQHLAAHAQISRVTLGSIERGDHAASLTTYRAMVQGLNRHRRPIA